MPTPQTSRPRSFLFLSIVLIAVVLIFAAVKYLGRDIVQVRVAGVNHQNLISSVSTNGKVEPVEEYQAHSTAPGVVERIFVEVGEKVKAGQLLVKLNDSDASARLASATSSLRSAEVGAQDIQQNGSTDERIGMAGDLSRAQTQQRQATSDLTALRLLQQKGAASTAEVTAAEQRLQNATSSLQSLQQRSTGRYSPADRTRAQ